MELESSLTAKLERINGVFAASTSEFSTTYSVTDYDDPTGDELGRIPYTPVFFTALATVIARKFHALRRPPCKVIVLDADQTLWSGVCGEDGPSGIRLDQPRIALQQFMRRQQESGKLLAVCSKNHEGDVAAAFQQGPAMPLTQGHFSAWRVNWLPKSENLKSLARELKLGLDSFVLIDDSPVECAEVAANCPEVLTLQLPDEPSLIPDFLEHCWVFDQLKTTQEDRSRAIMYQQNKLREELQSQSLSFADFVASLELVVDISPATSAQLPRLAQLTQRTNQFNVSGRRRSENELRQLAARCELLCVSVKDRLGDYGLVGALIFEVTDQTLIVDSFLLSCRALGRGVEHRMLELLGRTACKRGLKWLDIPFERLARNQPALEFLDSVGASFKQAHQYHFPAESAASAVFNPDRQPPPPAADSGTDASNKAATAQRKFVQCREIALELRNPAKIHERVESRAALQPRGKGGYVAPATPMERQLCDLWQNLLRVERVGTADDFFELGGHSLLAVRLFAHVEKMTGQKLPLVTLFQAPTVGQLASILGRQQTGGARSVLVPIQPHGSKPPLYLVHGAGGDVLWGYANLVAHMDPEQPVYALRSRGQIGLDELDQLEDMAAYYVQVVREQQPDGPYSLGGYCFGGNVAYEMARQIEADGGKVALLALIDSAPANVGYEKVQWWRPQFPMLFARNFYYWLQDFRTVPARDRRRFMQRKIRTLGRKVARWVRGDHGSKEVDLEQVIDPAHFPEHELKLWRIHLRALAGHVQKPCSAHVTLFRTRGHPLFSSFAPDLRWGALAEGGVTPRLISGSHENIFIEPNVRSLAIEMTAALAECQKRATPENNVPIYHHDAI